jgi:hypothetical protein
MSLAIFNLAILAAISSRLPEESCADDEQHPPTCQLAISAPAEANSPPLFKPFPSIA